MNDLAPIRPYPVPVNESARGDVIEALNLKARAHDPFFLQVTELTKALFDAPIAYLSLISGEEQCFLHMNGTDLTGTPRDMALCAFTVAKKQTIAIPDTHEDSRTRHHPIVVNPPCVRFFISAPVTLNSGFCIGTLCAVDLAPGPMHSAAKLAQLEHLAAMVARFYEVPLEPDPAHAARLNRIATEAQEEFLSLISHELRTPLHGILGLAQVLEPSDAEQGELIEAMIASGDHLSRIVDSILAFTDLRSGDITLEESEVDLAAVVTTSVGAFRKLAQISGKTLVVEQIADDPYITGDRAKLELALGCLVANFIAHGGDRGAISVIKQPDGELMIEVIDNGQGIAPAHQAAIWRAFGVGAKLSERATDGIGLGLPVANRAVELHGGELGLIPGGGSMSARIRLPGYRALKPLSA